MWEQFRNVTWFLFIEKNQETCEKSFNIVRNLRSGYQKKIKNQISKKKQKTQNSRQGNLNLLIQ